MQTACCEKLHPDDLRRMSELRDWLLHWRDGEGDALPLLVPELASLFGAERSAAMSFLHRPARWEIGLFHSVGFDLDLRQLHVDAAPDTPLRFGSYDPLRPERKQRNRALRLEDVMPRSRRLLRTGRCGGAQG